nr:glucosaminidase domain-containing protein [Lentilactobacillus otakiensis]
MRKQGWRVILIMLLTFAVLAAGIALRGQFSQRSQTQSVPTLVQKKPHHFSAQQKRTFISKVGNPAVKIYVKNRQVLPSVVIAQAILESQFGTSELSTDANNLFGIKGTYRDNRFSSTPVKLRTANRSKSWHNSGSTRIWRRRLLIIISW